MTCFAADASDPKMLNNIKPSASLEGPLEMICQRVLAAGNHQIVTHVELFTQTGLFTNRSCRLYTVHGDGNGCI